MLCLSGFELYSRWVPLKDKLHVQKLQNCTARVITKSRYDASVGPLLNMLGWDRVSIS